MSGALWRSTFLPPAKLAQNLAKRSLTDLLSQERHKYWDVEVLDNAVRTKGIKHVLAELKDAVQTGPESTRQLFEVLCEEEDKIGKWDSSAEPQRFLSLWRDRCFSEGWDDIRRQTEGVLFDCRWPSLQRVCDLQGARVDGAIDPNRISLLSSADGAYLLDIDRKFISVWNPQTGDKIDEWSSPVEISSAHALYDDVIALGLVDGQIYLWEISEGAQYPYAQLSKPIRSIVNHAEMICAWSYDGLWVLDEEGKAKFHIKLPLNEEINLAISSDGKRLICGEGNYLWVWSLETGKRLYQLSNDAAKSSDEEMMVAAILDMGTHERGLKAMDALAIWNYSLAEQFDILQSMSEPMSISSDGVHLVSCEEDGIALWRLGKGGYRQRVKLQVQNMWGVNALSSLSEDCRYVAAVMPDGISAWDLLGKKYATLPFPFAFATRITAVPKSRLIAVDNGQVVQIFQFVVD